MIGKFIVPWEKIPITYCIFRNNEIIYAGSSSNGLWRPFDFNHAMVTRAKILPNDQLQVTHCDSIEEAQGIEQQIISMYCPIYNRKDNPDRPFIPRKAQIPPYLRYSTIQWINKNKLSPTDPTITDLSDDGVINIIKAKYKYEQLTNSKNINK